MWSMQLRTAESSCEQQNSVLQRDERCQGHTTLTSQHMSSLKPSQLLASARDSVSTCRIIHSRQRWIGRTLLEARCCR